MILASGISLALAEVRKLISTTVQLVVHVERMLDGSRKITSITEIRGMDSGEIVFNDIFVYEMEKYEEGKVIGKFRSSIRFYPLFFQRLQKLKLVYDKIFVNE
jgi:pilus assembly protein CpaF